MKLFQNIDAKFKELDFEKIRENRYQVTYRRYNINGTHMIDILYEEDGRHVVQSYGEYFMDKGLLGNICVGLTAYEMELCLEKIKQMGWKIQKPS